MTIRWDSRRTIVVCGLAAAALFCAGVALGQRRADKPKSVIHVVTVDWAPGAAPADIQKALAGVETLAADYDGITRVWLRSFKSQGKDAAFVMEFRDEKALADYADSAAQKKWYEVYLPVRGESATSDITN